MSPRRRAVPLMVDITVTNIGRSPSAEGMRQLDAMAAAETEAWLKQITKEQEKIDLEKTDK